MSEDAAAAPPLPGLVLPGPPAAGQFATAARAAAPGPPAVAWGGFWRRAWVYAIDTPIVWILGAGAIAVLRFSAGVSVLPVSSILPLWRRSAQATPMLDAFELVLGILLWVGYFGVFESSEWGATPGKRALGLRVTDLAGRRISLGRAVARRLGMLLSLATFAVGFLMAGFTRKRQALHDMVAGTLVVREVGSSGS